MLAKVDSGGDGGEGQSGAEVARVEALLVERDKAVVAGDQTGSESVEFGGGELASCSDFAGSGGMGPVRGDCLEGRCGAQRNFSAGELFYTGEVAGIEAEAEAGKLAERRRIFGIVGGEHAGGGPGGLGHRGAAVENGDPASASSQIEGEGETDDPGTGDDYIGCFHSSIVGRGCRSRV